MCNYQYLSEDTKKCPYPALYRRLNKLVQDGQIPNKLAGFNFELSHDANGCCIFHSDDALWKWDKRMIEQFRLLNKAIRMGQQEKLLKFDIWDFDGFVFAGQDEDRLELPREGGQEIINLSELVFPECVTFNNCRFLHPVWFSYCTFHKISTFKNTTFESDADFSETKFNARISFVQTKFSLWASFRETVFKSFAEFQQCDFKVAAFNKTTFNSYATFENSTFSSAHFTETLFPKDHSNNSMANFRKTNFDNLLKMEGVVFDREVDFTGTSFNVAEFINVAFSNAKTTLFDHILVKSQLLFKSLAAGSKTFNHLVTFNIQPEEITGEIIFENANLYFIKQYELIRELAKPGTRKVVIGPGCDKYRLKKEFIIPMKEEWRFLIEEMAATYTAFFNWEQTYMVAISAECEYQSEHVLVRYYADADIDQPEFENILMSRTPVFFKFLKDPQAFMREHMDAATNDRSITNLTGDLDIYRQVQSARTGLAARIIFDQRWSVEETKAMLLAIAQQPDATIAVEFNSYIINQKDFFSFGSKKFIAGGDIHYQPNSNHDSSN